MRLRCRVAMGGVRLGCVVLLMGLAQPSSVEGWGFSGTPAPKVEVDAAAAAEALRVGGKAAGGDQNVKPLPTSVGDTVYGSAAAPPGPPVSDEELAAVKESIAAHTAQQLEKAAELKRNDPASAAANLLMNRKKVVPTVNFGKMGKQAYGSGWDVPVPPPGPPLSDAQMAAIKESISAHTEKQRVERLTVKAGSASGGLGSFGGAGLGGLGGFKSWKSAIGEQARKFAAARGDGQGGGNEV